MNRISEANIHIMRGRLAPAVITMPARRPGVVVAMPPRTSKVVTMPTHGEGKTIAPAPNSASQPSPAPASKLSANCDAIYCGVRMTLLALLALLGWPRPTRDNDPGPSAARPGFWERISLISTLHLTDTALPAATRAAVVDFPAAFAEKAA